MKTGGFELFRQLSQIVHPKFDLSLDRHGKNRVYGSRQATIEL
jgi:hypothetical protein